MNRATNSQKRNLSKRQSNPITIGQVAAHAETFSQTASLPASFGKYDNFFLSLHSLDNDTRQMQQKQWLRRHRYRGDERMRGYHHASLSRRRMNGRELKKYPTCPFSSPEKVEEVYEDDNIEAERGCVVGQTLVRELSIKDSSNDFGGTATQQSSNTKQFTSQPMHDASPIDLGSNISANDKQKHSAHLNSRKKELSLMELDNAFMELTLDLNPSIVTPDSTSVGDNLKISSPKHVVDTLSSSLEPVVHSRSSSLCSNLNAQLDSIVLSQEQPVYGPKSIENTYVSPSKSIQSENIARTPVYSTAQEDEPVPTTLFEPTPLSEAIINKRRKSISSTKVRNSHNESPTISTVTAKRKPRGTVSSSSKRRRKEPNINVTHSTPAPRILYDDKTFERVRDVKKCTDKHCKWNPNLHERKAACEKCWTLASSSEKRMFIENGGRHLRINLVKGGCPSSCKLFSHRKISLFEGDGEDIRLCRKCFDDMHHVGVRKTGM